MECIICKKSSREVKIRRCTKCRVTPYCSRDCQKTDWKVHKKTCDKRSGSTAPAPAPAPEPAASSSSSSSSSPSSSPSSVNLPPLTGLEHDIDKPYTRLNNGTWLHDRPKKDVYSLLIDAYRLRVEDMYTLSNYTVAGCRYDRNSDGKRGFLDFLNLAQSRPGLLPSWWDADTRIECVCLATKDSWHSLPCAVDKMDMVEHYGDDQFHMQLRMFAEDVYGSSPFGMSRQPTIQMMMSFEQGRIQGEKSFLRMSSIFRR